MVFDDALLEDLTPASKDLIKQCSGGAVRKQ